MKRSYQIALSLFLSLVLAGSAYAEGHEGKRGHKRMSFEEIDTSGDGKLSFDEFRAMHEAKLERRFSRLDGDGDGSVSVEEFAEAKGRMKERMRQRRRGYDQQ